MITLLVCILITFVLAGCALNDYAKVFFNDKDKNNSSENYDLSL